jgi:hypothetical protein
VRVVRADFTAEQCVFLGRRYMMNIYHVWNLYEITHLANSAIVFAEDEEDVNKQVEAMLRHEDPQIGEHFDCFDLKMKALNPEEKGVILF